MVVTFKIICLIGFFPETLVKSLLKLVKIKPPNSIYIVLLYLLAVLSNTSISRLYVFIILCGCLNTLDYDLLANSLFLLVQDIYSFGIS